MMGKGTQSTLLRNRPVIRRPLPQTPSPASPLLNGKVLPMCPVRSVTYVSTRSSEDKRLLNSVGLGGQLFWVFLQT
jgi:hypothetical protein